MTSPTLAELLTQKTVSEAARLQTLLIDRFPQYRQPGDGIYAWAHAALTGGRQLEWADYERIADLPDVHEVLQGFAEDPTGDNGTCVVRAVKLQLTIYNNHLRSGTVDIQHDEVWIASVDNRDDEGAITEADYSATRLAIVGAAAQIALDQKEK